VHESVQWIAIRDDLALAWDDEDLSAATRKVATRKHFQPLLALA
jgi:hypothetical protein